MLSSPAPPPRPKLRDVGFSDVAVDELPAPVRAASCDEWRSRTRALAGPLANMLAALPEEARQAQHARAREAIAPYETADGLETPGVTLLAAGRRWLAGGRLD
jgi:hypothetical protein